MDHAVDAFDGFIEDAWLFGVGDVVKVVDLHKVELSRVLRSGFFHSFALGQRPGRTADSDAPAEQLVYDMGTDETGGAGDKDVLSIAGQYVDRPLQKAKVLHTLMAPC